jgi:hypothetical protein
MANDLYDSGAEAILNGDIDFDTDTIRLTCVDTADYTINLATHDFYDDVTAGGRVANGALASKTITDGVFDAADLVLSAVTGDPFELIVLDKNTAGADSTDPLLIAFDTFTGNPTTPNGADITIQFNAAGILDVNP